MHNSLISKNEFGLRSGLSTEEATNVSRPCQCVYTVCHKCILLLMSGVAVSRGVVAWFGSSYLGQAACARLVGAGTLFVWVGVSRGNILFIVELDSPETFMSVLCYWLDVFYTVEPYNLYARVSTVRQ